MARITREEVLRIAHLARLRLSDEEAVSMTDHLENLLGYVAQLDEVDTEGIEPTAHVIPLATPLRADEPAGTLAAEEAVANAPARDGTAFAVPKVLEGEDEG